MLDSTGLELFGQGSGMPRCTAACAGNRQGAGTTLPQEVMTCIPKVDGVILGPVPHREYPTRDKGGINRSGVLRVKFELCANIRLCRSRKKA